MKKFLFLVAVALTGVTYAQTEKGGWMAGADLGLSYTSTSTTVKNGSSSNDLGATNVFKFTPNLNYFVIDNLAVGLGLSYTNTKKKDTDAVNEFAIMPNATYFFPLGGDVAPFVGAGVGYGSASQGSHDSEKASGLIFGVKGGVAYFVNSGVALTGSVGYDYKNYTNKADSNIKANIGTLGVGIGVAVFF